MTTLTSFVPTIDTVPLPLRRFTADEFIAMAQSGAFDEQHRVELFEGLIVEMSPSGSPHNYVLLKLNHLFTSIAGKVCVGVQSTLRVNDQQVYDPDPMLLKPPLENYSQNLPRPEDILLVIEVAETSWDRDSKVKLPVYAAAGIADYWIVDIDRERLFVYRSPKGEQYLDVRELLAGDQIAPLAAPDFSIAVATLFA